MNYEKANRREADQTALSRVQTINILKKWKFSTEQIMYIMRMTK
jgi:hypothetical protein